MNLAIILRPLKQTMWYKNLNLQEYIYADQDSTLISHLETYHFTTLWKLTTKILLCYRFPSLNWS